MSSPSLGKMRVQSLFDTNAYEIPPLDFAGRASETTLITVTMQSCACESAISKPWIFIFFIILALILLYLIARIKNINGI